jgi:hypothetical protein
MKYNILCLVLLVSVCGLAQKKQNNDILSVDVTGTYPRKTLKLQDIANVRYIPLTTTDTFLMSDGGVNVMNIYAGNDYIIYRELSTNAILVYSGKGEPLTYIDKRGQSSKEYIIPYSGFFDADNSEIFILDFMSGKMLVYGVDGNYRRHFEFPKFITSSLLNCDKNNFMVYRDISFDPNAGTERYFIFSKQTGKLVQKFDLPFKKLVNADFFNVKNTSGHSAASRKRMAKYPLKKGSSGLILTDDSSDTVYRFINGKLSPFITRTPPVTSMSDRIFLTYSDESSEYIFMNTVRRLSNKESFDYNMLAYNKSENRIYSVELQNADFPSQPKTETGSIVDFPIYANSTVMALLTPTELIEAYNAGKLNGKLKDVAAKLNEDDNPVLMIAELY